MAKQYKWKDASKKEVIVTEQITKEEIISIEGKQKEIDNMKGYLKEAKEKVTNIENEINKSETDLAFIKSALI